MSFVDTSQARGKPDDYLATVSRAVHDALVAELNVNPDDNLQPIRQHGPGEVVVRRALPGGPRSDDWSIFTITDGPHRSDVFVMMTVTPAADGTAASTAPTYSKAEMRDAVAQLFQEHDRSRILPILSDDVVLTLPATLPYGGEFTGRAAFDEFFAKSPGGGDVWISFDIVVDDVIAADDHVIARLTNTAVPKATGKPVVFQNLWLFGVEGGRIVSVQLYADTAVTTK